MSRQMPKQKPGRSKQDYSTPQTLIDAVLRYLGEDDFYVDLAATKENAKAKRFITPEQDALSPDTIWYTGKGWGWLNPPFGDVYPWVSKARSESVVRGSKIVMLLPASVGAVWFHQHVHNWARAIFFLRPRISFDGKAPYPKDCMLVFFDESHRKFEHHIRETHYFTWRWSLGPGTEG